MDLELPKINPAKWAETYADALYAYAFIRIRDREKAMDIVQETFLAALEGADNFKGNSSEKTWLIAILKNKIIDMFRKQSRMVYMNDNSDYREDSFFEENGHWTYRDQPLKIGFEQFDKLENKELASVLQKCIDKLPWLARSFYNEAYR